MTTDAEERIPALRALHWSVRRELWENRSIYLAPVVVAALFLVGFFVGLVGLTERMRAAAALGPAEQQGAVEQPYVTAAIMLMAIALVVAVVYCLDALYGERRDRSILFWRSLPVSDLTTVLAKASIPILILPLVGFAVTVVTHVVMLVASSAVLAGSGMSPGTVWGHVPFFEVSATNFVHLVAFHGIWYAPFYGWLLLASAWAKRAPLLWATLPPLSIGAVEKIAFGSSRFAALLQDRFLGGPLPGAPASTMTMTMDVLAPHSLGYYLTSPGMWIGLAVTAVFLLAAVRLHRARALI